MIPRPKILTAITVPAGGITLKLYASKAADYDTALVATVAAGTYFMSGDNQNDDFLRALQVSITAAIAGAGGVGGGWVSVEINNTSHKVVFAFTNGFGIFSAKARIAWTESSSQMCSILGNPTTPDDNVVTTNDVLLTCDWPHGWGWYADEDGQLEALDVEDRNVATILQSTSLSGRTKTQYVGGHYRSQLKLQFLERYFNSRTKVYSRGVAYGSAPVYPYNRNEPLECWWLAVRDGTRFRVYPNGRIDADPNYTRTTVIGQVPCEVIVPTAVASPAVTDNTKSWSTEPQRWAGGILWSPRSNTGIDSLAGGGQCFHIASSTATTITLTNGSPTASVIATVGHTSYLYDNRYQTYVLDTEEMSEFAPDEIPTLDRYNITIPLKRYVA